MPLFGTSSSRNTSILASQSSKRRTPRKQARFDDAEVETSFNPFNPFKSLSSFSISPFNLSRNINPIPVNNTDVEVIDVQDCPPFAPSTPPSPTFPTTPATPMPPGGGLFQGADTTVYMTPNSTAVSPSTTITTLVSNDIPSKLESTIEHLQIELQIRHQICTQYEADLSTRSQIEDLLQQTIDHLQKNAQRWMSESQQWKKKFELVDKERSLTQQLCAELERQETKRPRDVDQEAIKAMQTKIEQLDAKNAELELTLENARRRNVNTQVNRSLAAESSTTHPTRRDDGEVHDTTDASGRLSTWEEDSRRQGEGLQLNGGRISPPETKTPNTTTLSPKARSSRTSPTGVSRRLSFHDQSQSVRYETKSSYASRSSTMDETHSSAHSTVDPTEKQLMELRDEVQGLEKEREQLVGQKEQLNRALEAELKSHDTSKRALSDLERRFAEAAAEIKEHKLAIEDLDAQNRGLARENMVARDRMTVLQQERRKLQEQIQSESLRKDDLIDGQATELEHAREREFKIQDERDECAKERDQAKSIAEDLRAKLASITAETESRKRRIHDLEKKNASMELEINQLKRRAEIREDDVEGLNIALDLKQQELLFFKRKGSGKDNASRVSLATSAALNASAQSSQTLDVPATDKSLLPRVPSTPLRTAKSWTTTPSTVRPERRDSTVGHPLLPKGLSIRPSRHSILAGRRRDTPADPESSDFALSEDQEKENRPMSLAAL